MVAAEGLHDGGLVQELDSLPQVGRLVHCFDRNMRLPLALNNVLGDALVDHAEGALAQFPQNGDLLSGHLPLVLLVHCRQHISSNALLRHSLTMAQLRPRLRDTQGSKDQMVFLDLSPNYFLFVIETTFYTDEHPYLLLQFYCVQDVYFSKAATNISNNF